VMSAPEPVSLIVLTRVGRLPTAGQLVIDLDAGFFLVGGGERLLEILVEGLDETSSRAKKR